MMEYEENHILNNMNTYEEYVEHEYTSGYVGSNNELYFNKADFIEYKKAQNIKENK